MAVSFHSLHRIKKNDTELELWSINKSDFYKEFRTVADIGMPFCIVGLIGNGVLFWLLCCTIKKSPFTIYVANMAVGDVIVLLHYFVAYLLIFLPPRASFYYHNLRVIPLMFGSDTNIYFLTAMSTERYVMVLFPVWFEARWQKHLTSIVCVSLWTLTVILTVIEYYCCHPRYLLPHIIGFLYCHTAIVFQYIVNYLIFIPVMVFSTLALLIKMQKNPPQNFPAVLDISIVATVFMHLLLSTFIKIMVFMNYLAAFMPSSQYRRASLILDCADTSVNPFVYLLVGCWKKEKSQESLHELIERSLKAESNRNLRTQDQEQA
uniref:mas-related G-protein coupled receptor member H-like n=1 Tax=Euleptes europaea TaxID=460621 RepID=UPI002540BF18|nr:mas-related G-protein coupled receptor member H-like [Euleptes europaea]